MEKRPRAATIQEVVDRYSRIVNVTHSTDGIKHSIRLAGFKYNDFDRSGNLNIAKLSEAMQHIHYAMFTALERQGIFIYRVANMVVLTRHLRIWRRLYDLAAVDLPMNLTWWISRVGSSSVDVQQILTHADGGKSGELTLAECVIRAIAVDIQSRRTSPLPENIRRQFDGVTSPGTLNLPTFPCPAEVPPNAFTCTMQVRYEDTDMLQRTTQSSYIAFAHECASQATAAGYLTRLKGDFAFYFVESLTGIHVGETFAGDELKVSTWEDAADGLLLYFVARKHEKTVFYAQMRFHDVVDKTTSKL